MASKAEIISIFEHFREELDDHNDRRERLIKASRDATNLSKKVIFLLHRIAMDESESNPALRASQLGKEKLHEIQELFSKMKPDLEGDRFWRYHYQVSPGLQEYIEALSFAHYLEHKTLITFAQVQATLCDATATPYFPLPISDYFLGVSDLTGEMMRFAISGLSKRGGRAIALEVCSFVRECRADFERFTPYVWELKKKQQVTNQSLQKIEDACYAVVLRGSEYDLPPDMLDDIVSQSISRFQTDDWDSYQRHSRRDNDETELGNNYY